jgi:hypothetical protein
MPNSSPVVALWEDPTRGLRGIPLETGAPRHPPYPLRGLAARRRADGRGRIDNVTEYFDAAIHQVRASGAGSQASNSKSEASAPRLLELDELTIFTGWAQSLAEVLAYAPERVEALRPTHGEVLQWRAALGIKNPPLQLNEAVDFIGRAVRAVAPTKGMPALDALHVWCREDPPGEHALDQLVRRVLRSTLEPLRARQADETGAYERYHEKHSTVHWCRSGEASAASRLYDLRPPRCGMGKP